jgi:hypothetical protein
MLQGMVTALGTEAQNSSKMMLARRSTRAKAGGATQKVMAVPSPISKAS